MEKTKQILEELHHKLAERMLEQLLHGNPEAKDLAVIVKFLKDNNIELNALNGSTNAPAFNELIQEATRHLDNLKH